MKGLALLLVAGPPVVTAAASPAGGVAPLRVTLTATVDAASYTWEFGDGTTAAGAAVAHVYRPGRHVATVTAANELGETAQAQVVVTVPARTLALAVADAAGRFRTTIRLAAPGPYEARSRETRSPARTILLRPRLEASVPATVALGGTARVRARLVPAAAGVVRTRVLAGRRLVAEKRRRAASITLPTRAARSLRVVVETEPRPGYAARRTLETHVVLRDLGSGSRGPSVFALERRLAELRYALRGADAPYATDTFEAVLAFQKVHRLPRTGRVDGALWRRLAVAAVPRPRQGGDDHLEIDKSRNVLYEVVGGRVARIVHVSTGATGNTPVGTFHVYRKVVGWDWVLWYPMYFLRGFAVHGYPSVPADPASHGCVRVPMWIAPSLFSRHGYGTRIVVFT